MFQRQHVSLEILYALFKKSTTCNKKKKTTLLDFTFRKNIFCCNKYVEKFSALKKNWLYLNFVIFYAICAYERK